MKKIVLNIMTSLLFISCTNTNNMITIINCNNISGKPEHMLFKTENEGYMFIYKGDMYSSASDAGIFIYKTTDGGKNWEQIYYQVGYIFARYSEFTLFNNAIFGTVEKPEDITIYNLFRFDLATQEFKLINPDAFGVDKVGGKVLVKGDNISTFFSKDKHRGFLTTDTNFSSYSLEPFNYILQNGVVISDSTNIYFITWKNQLVIETNGKYKEIEINSPTCIAKIAENKVLIATNEYKNTINLYQYDVSCDKLEKLHAIDKYWSISYLQSNEKVIVGFIGTETYFPMYDLIYSTDKGQTWQIQKLKDKLMISPNCLVDNVLYVYSGGKLQKITF